MPSLRLMLGCCWHIILVARKIPPTRHRIARDDNVYLHCHHTCVVHTWRHTCRHRGKRVMIKCPSTHLFRLRRRRLRIALTDRLFLFTIQPIPFASESDKAAGFRHHVRRVLVHVGGGATVVAGYTLFFFVADWRGEFNLLGWIRLGWIGGLWLIFIIGKTLLLLLANLCKNQQQSMYSALIVIKISSIIITVLQTILEHGTGQLFQNNGSY